jgi:hypothetical protein
MRYHSWTWSRVEVPPIDFFLKKTTPFKVDRIGAAQDARISKLKWIGRWAGLVLKIENRWAAWSINQIIITLGSSCPPP